MFNMQDTSVQEFDLYSSIKELDKINKQIAKLTVKKEELTDNIIAAFGHEKEGQKTYEYGMWKVEVKTPFNYSLNKKLYEGGEIYLPTEFNPIKSSISYTVDKKLCEQYLETAPEQVRKSLIELIDKKPGKPSVTIKERV